MTMTMTKVIQTGFLNFKSQKVRDVNAQVFCLTISTNQCSVACFPCGIRSNITLESSNLKLMSPFLISQANAIQTLARTMECVSRKAREDSNVIVPGLTRERDAREV